MKTKLEIVAWIVLCLNCITFAGSQKNVLLICVDDLRPELGCYGATQVKSPHIDKLASEGLLFERAYCNVPVCGPSRACLLSGLLPTPQRFNKWRVDTEKQVPKTLPQVFKEAGYHTLSIGKIFHHHDDCEAQSWSEPAWRSVHECYMESYDPNTVAKRSKRGRGRFYELPDVQDGTYPDGRIAAQTVKDLRRMKESGQPFFIACGFIRPHLPFYAPKKYWDLYKRESIVMADNRFKPRNAPAALVSSNEYRNYFLEGYDPQSDAFHRLMRHAYYACVSYIDQLVGNILAELEILGLAENTIVVLWGDHGWNLGEHTFWGKHNTVHLSLRVPLILKVPGQAKDHKSNALIESSDFCPTLCELTGLPAPKQLQGQSFAPVFFDPNASFRDFVYSRFGAGDAVITERYAFTRYSGKQPGIMLYDHQKDPRENENVAGNPEYKSIIEDMERRLKESKARGAVLDNIEMTSGLTLQDAVGD